ncbi:STAS domain-containing protein [Saccharothrix yanglingensis]|uniref:STAS domain-containing protein n=1 Tax=Saccharothrix yanglingensis TaxID=659496 RepID=UPI0027D2154D|nr:STAS domain-containing protein [Saccharothrix yanglingensis]
MEQDVHLPPVNVGVAVARRRGVVFADVRGEVDTDSYRHLRQELFSCLGGGPAALVVDLRHVDFFGSLGIAVLMEVHERATELGAAFALVAEHRTVVEPIRITEVGELLGLCSTVEEAVARVEGGPAGAEADGFSWWSS